MLFLCIFPLPSRTEGCCKVTTFNTETTRVGLEVCPFITTSVWFNFAFISGKHFNSHYPLCSKRLRYEKVQEYVDGCRMHNRLCILQLSLAHQRNAKHFKTNFIKLITIISF